MRRFSFSSLWVRLLLLILLAVIPIVGLTFYRDFELRRLVVADVREEALRLARLAASDQQDSIRGTRQLLFALAQLPQVREADPLACSTFFAQLLRQYPQYTLLGVIAPDGQVFCSAYPTSGPLNMAGEVFFQRVLQSQDYALGDYQTDTISGKAILNSGYPVLDETGQIRAVVFATLDLTWLNELAVEAQLPPGSTFTVIDRNGTILVRYPDPEQWVGRSMPEAPIIEFILNQQTEGTTEALGVDGVPRLFAFTPLFDAPANEEVYVNIGIPLGVAFADANRVLARNLLALGLVTMLALAAAWIGSNWFILRWVEVLVAAAERLGAGDLSVRTRLPYGQGELSQLARAFDTMAQSLEQRVTERDEAVASLRETQRALSTLLSNLPGMAYRCTNDPNRTIQFVNEGCLELTGYSPTQLIEGDTVRYGDLIHPDDRERVWQKIQRALAERQPFRISYRLITRSGEEKWVWEQGCGVYSPAGALLAMEGFIIDATERVLAYQMLEQRVADRTRALSALYDVTAVASQSLDLEMVLTHSLDRVLAVMGGQAGTVHLDDETGGKLRLAAWREVTPGEAGREGFNLPLDRLTKQVFERRQPQVVPDITTAEAVRTSAIESQAYVGVPMRVRGRVLGVLSVIGKTGRQWHPDEVALLDSIADQIAVAVENARLYQQAEQLAVLNERSRLARDLHDSVTQSLYSVVLLAEAGRRSADSGDVTRLRGYLAGLNEAAQQALREMRLLVYELRPPVLEQEGLVGALRQRLEAVEGRAGVETRWLGVDSVSLPGIVEEGLYRIAQEALNNALKHATATTVTVRLDIVDHGIELEVADNGVGFEPDRTGGGGMGLANMRERAERLGGRLILTSTPERGTNVTVKIPSEENEPEWSPVLAGDSTSVEIVL